MRPNIACPLSFHYTKKDTLFPRTSEVCVCVMVWDMSHLAKPYKFESRRRQGCLRAEPPALENFPTFYKNNTV